MSSNRTRVLERIFDNIVSNNETSTDSELHYLLDEYLSENLQFHKPDEKSMPKVFSSRTLENKKSPENPPSQTPPTITVPGGGADGKRRAMGTQREKEKPVIVILCATTKSYNEKKSWKKIIKIKDSSYFTGKEYKDFLHYYVGDEIDEAIEKIPENDILIKGNINDEKVQSKIPSSISVLINEYCTMFPETQTTIRGFLDRCSVFVNFHKFKPALHSMLITKLNTYFKLHDHYLDNKTYIYVKNTRPVNLDERLSIQQTTVSTSGNE